MSKYVEYHMQPEYLDGKVREYAEALGGKDPLPVFVTNIANAIRKKGEYLRFGPYWWAVKRILNRRGDTHYGEGTSWMADEYTEMNPNGTPNEARTLVAAWEFSEDVRAKIGPYEVEYEFRDHVVNVTDDDMS